MPKLTEDDLAAMEKFNPTSRAQIEDETKIQDFLNGGEPPKPADDAADPHAGHEHP